MNELVTREIQFRAADPLARTVEGIGVPFDTRIELWPGVTEEFARGSIEAEGALLYWQHREVIGKVIEDRNTDTGWELRGRISETPRGEEALTLARDGVINKFSIGFEPIEWRDDADGHRVYTRARVREVSLVSFPAYETAEITQVRSEQTALPTSKENRNMETEMLTRADLDSALDRQAEEMTRNLDTRFAAFQAPGHDDTPAFRSAGEFIKALAGGDEAAAGLYRQINDSSEAGDRFRRAYTGANSGDGVSRNQWVGEAINLVDRGRKVLNSFSRDTLGAEGMNVEYAKLASNTVNVGKQATQGADLVKGKVTLTTETAPVLTLGGWTELTRQAIERASVNVLNITLRALQIKYSAVTEAEFMTVFNAVMAAQVTAGDKLTLAATAKNADWLDVITDAAEKYDSLGYDLAGLYVSKEVFKSLYRLEDTAGQNLMNVYGTGINVSGSLDVTSISGNIAKLPVKLLPGVTGKVAAFYDPIAITTYENAGAPLTLQDENILNLSKSFSVYGYAAFAPEFADAITPVVFAS